MYFSDLSEYDSFDVVEELEATFQTEVDALDLRNIGWLEKGKDFPTGEHDEAVIDALFELCKSPHNVMRGFHLCDLCPENVTGGYPPMPSFTRGEEKRFLGHAEVWVRGKNNIIYAAPNLILHYVSAHYYLPPQEFIKALLRKP